jgi:hypothetical protein
VRSYIQSVVLLLLLPLQVALVEQLLDEVWSGPWALTLNPGWHSNTPAAYQGLVNSFEAAYSFMPIATQVGAGVPAAAARAAVCCSPNLPTHCGMAFAVLYIDGVWNRLLEPETGISSTLFLTHSLQRYTTQISQSSTVPRTDCCSPRQAFALLPPCCVPAGPGAC